jgi:hypothetical protein
MRVGTRAVGITALLALLVPPAASAQVAATLNATRVKSRLRMWLVPGEVPNGPPVIKLAVDNSEFHPLTADRQFLVSRPLSVTLRHFNPLRVAVTVKVDDAADPNHAVAAKLVEALRELSAVLGADLSKDGSTSGLRSFIAEGRSRSSGLSGCTAPEEAVAHITTLDLSLNDPIWGAERLASEIKKWSTAIDEAFDLKKSGPEAMRAGLIPLESFLGDDEAPAAGTINRALADASQAVKKIDDALKKENPTPCEEAALPTYRLLRMTNPAARLQTLKTIQKGIADIKALLDGYKRSARWSVAEDSEFEVRSGIEPTGETMKNVLVSFSSVQYQPALKKEEVASAKMTIRRYSPWVPEIGIGLTYAFVTRPKYGTGKNAAGETVITAAESESGNIDPSIMANMVCGFCGLSAVTPMFQIGVTTAKTTPAIFLGAGLRLLPTSKGEFAVGGGFAFPWARQLKPGVAPGKVIAGTAELENNLEWRRLEGPHYYLNLQYKF